MLGTRLAADAAAAGHDVTVTGHDVDAADKNAVAKAVADARPDVIVNCAAYTAVDAAESDVDGAVRGNVTVPTVLAAAAESVGARLVHVSTDYVFDGTGSRPLREDDPTGPQSVYGKSKLDGEAPVVAGGGLVVRTSWLYGPTHKNFVRTMLTLMADREQLRVVADQRGRPTSTSTLSTAILSLLAADARGVVHVADATADDAGADRGISWHDFASAIADEGRAAGLPLRVNAIEAIPSAAYPTPARRPAWSVFDTSRYSALTGRALPTWQGTLKAVVAAIAAAQLQKS
jgi:dTDP-4-dehydrorhamnose reductase